MAISNLRVVREHPGRLDAGVYHKPKWALLFDKDDKPCRRPINCGGDRRPLGQDLENACEGLGLNAEQIYTIPIIEK